MEFDAGFFETEERCNFTVNSDMKKVWAVELELLEKLTSVCQKYNLVFHASGGTLLGAVRHKGFIPWDDDIDIMMLREDYEKLCSVAKEEFEEPYFFQTHYTDVDYTRGHAQLRDSRTTGILEYELGKCNFNQGIFIDIFPLDNIPDDENEVKKLQKAVFMQRKLLNLTIDYKVNTPKTFVKNVAHIILNTLLNPDKLYKKLENLSASYNNKDCKRVAPISSFPLEDKLFFPKNAYNEIAVVPFENISIPIPSDYDTLLKIQYGKWETPLKENSYHGGIIFDTEKSYKEYLKK